MPDSTARTTETSKSEGRLKVDAGCCHGRKRCLKCAIKPKDGMGGINLKMSSTPGYGKTPAFKSIGVSTPTIGKKKKVGSIKMKRFKSAKISKKKSVIKSLLRKAKK